MSQREELRERTKQFALRVLRLFRALPNRPDAQEVGRQLLRSAMSVAANYRAVGRARSRKEFVAKYGVVVEEMDESVFWLEMLADGGIVPRGRLSPLQSEANEILAIVAAAHGTATGRRRARDDDSQK